MTKAKRVFISHATADAQFAHRLADDLRRFGVQVWIAPESIRPGESWVDAIERGLGESSHTVVVLTPNALKSRWVKKETGVAIAQERKGRIQVIPLDVEPCAVPLLLSSYQMLSFRHDYDAGLSQLAAILGLRVTPPEPLRPPRHAPPHGTVPEAVRPSVKKKPAGRGGLPIWSWVAIGGLVLLAVVGGVLLVGRGEPTPAPIVVGATTPAATVAPTATPVPMIDTSTPKPPPPTPTPMRTPTPAPEATKGPAAPAVTDIMVEIPAGPFIMGNDTGAEDEAPAHEVDLPAFEIDKFEVINADFAQFVEATGYQTDAEKAVLSRTWRDTTEGKDNHPVVYISWNDAVAYCQWLGKRLPNEAEWEKAARGEEGFIYPWGNEWDPAKANVKESGLRGTVAVGSFAEGVSPYGVFDMAGNVWEWTADWYEAYPGSSFQSPYFGEKYRVLRGGGWFESADFVRTTTRNATSDTAANDDLGFRCVR